MVKAKPRQKKKITRRFWAAGLILIIIIIAAIIYLLWPAPVSAPRSLEKPVAKVPASTSLECAEKLPPGELAGQVLMIGLPAIAMTDQASLFKKYHVGGAVIMTSPANPGDGSVLRFKAQASNKGEPLLVATDEEGGIVQRFASLGALPPPAPVAAQYSPAAAEDLIAKHGLRLKAVGIDMVLGPLADVAPEHGDSPLGDRIFSSDPYTVASYDKAYVRGWQRAGLIATLKHFPGLGSATGNTDYQPATTPPLSSLETRDFIPYKSLKSAGTAVMVGAQNVPGWFNGPASLSPVVNRYLRQTLGYKDSLVVTDSLAANAVTSLVSAPEAAASALEAGNDIALIVDPNVGMITTEQNAAIIKNAESAIEAAVKNGALSKLRLAQAATHKLSAQRLSACSISAR